jgi:hypothetical protein
MIRVVHPGSRILMLTFSHPGSRGQKGTQSRIPDPDPQHCPVRTVHFKLIVFSSERFKEVYCLKRLQVATYKASTAG